MPSASRLILVSVALCGMVGACTASGRASPEPAAPPAKSELRAVADPSPAPEPDPMPSDRAPADPSKPQAHVGEPVGAGPFGQFIVKYRDDSQPLKQQGAVQPRLDRTAAQAGKSGIKLTWKHRMGINADVFAVSPALSRGEAIALMNAFAADPDVQFIEPDNHISLGPIIRQPEAVDK
ncbi:hypothetical protein ACI2IY_23160 [Lysobacter enzymogenes]|uniref:hypothetical protein n=1 Tax=Lysobacter enzymogenes TaxID=69 RepID=UPI00384BCDD4